ncbi:hypothetical protein DFH28DRAFT_960394 [Melampsora americana]|nr:hypothetical protein DFH28DRAFT_960394 [Melampsora americana]
MHSSLCLLIHVALHSLVHIFVHGDVSLMRIIHTEADANPLIAHVDDIAHHNPVHAPQNILDDLNISEEPFSSEMSKIQRIKHKSKLKVNRVVKKVFPPRPEVPYFTFFITAKDVNKDQDFQESTRNLAKEVLKLVSKRFLSPEKPKLHISQKQNSLIELFKSAKNTLEDRKVPTIERLWIIGLVAGLLKHMPSDASEVRYHLEKDLWKDYLFLEIQTALAFESSFTEMFLSQYSKGVSYHFNPEMQECLNRAQFLKRHDHRMQEEDSQRSANLEEYVVDQFLNIKIPSSKKDIEQAVQRFSAIFKDLDYSTLQGEQAIGIFHYLTRHHWKSTMNIGDIIKYIKSDVKLYRDFSSPFARFDLKVLLEKNGVPSKIKALIADEFKDKLPPSSQTIQNIIKALQDSISNSHVESDIYKFLIIECILHPEVNKIVIDSIQKNEKLALQIEYIRNRDSFMSKTQPEGRDFLDFFNYIHSDYLLYPKNLKITKTVSSS